MSCQKKREILLAEKSHYDLIKLVIAAHQHRWGTVWGRPIRSVTMKILWVSCTLNRVSCHHFRWCGTSLTRREMKWVSSRWNHVYTVTDTWWVLELNGMRAYEIANMKQCIVGVCFIHGFICVLMMWHSWKQQNKITIGIGLSSMLPHIAPAATLKSKGVCMKPLPLVQYKLTVVERCLSGLIYRDRHHY